MRALDTTRPALAAARRLISVAMLASGCATAVNRDLATNRGVSAWPAVRRDSDTITQAEIAASHEVVTLEAVRLLRPRFLRGSARMESLGGRAEVAAYLDGMYAGDVSRLYTVPATAVREQRFMK